MSSVTEWLEKKCKENSWWYIFLCPIQIALFLYSLACYFLCLLLIAWAWIIISLVVTHISLVLNKTPPSLFIFIPDMIFGWFGTNIASLKANAQYAPIISDMIAAFAFVVTAYAVVKAQTYKIRLQRERQKVKKEIGTRMGIQSFPIGKKGVDDIEWLITHYKEEVDYITIFAGGFSWLVINEKMRSRILELAKDNKLRLISNKSRHDVIEAFKRKRSESIFNELKDCFKFDSGLEKVVCTVIKKSPTEWKLLYRSRLDELDHDFNACVLSDKDSTRELLYIISNLAEHIR